jgi:hypothetical protein
MSQIKKNLTLGLKFGFVQKIVFELESISINHDLFLMLEPIILIFELKLFASNNFIPFVEMFV